MSEDVLKIIGKEFLGIESNDPQELHECLQGQIKEIYKEVKDKIDFTSDETINDSVAAIASDSPDTPAIGAWLPKEYKKHEGTKMECTLGSAMVKLALEESGELDVQTALIKGHQVAIRNNEDGGITVFDPTTTHTTEGTRHGFMHSFTNNEVSQGKDIYDKNGKLRGQQFRIGTTEKPSHTGMFEDFDEEKKVCYRDFFASEPDTLVELSVILENLDDGKYKQDYDWLSKYSSKELCESLEIFNHKDVLN